ncbi:GNAT family N-acetyltransferase [Bdellovibrio svalbardensis]|uniref:GNAT family N-acetyltransferase n=1 Tax=Bdellovibrio svalbardensis TaxID=2972972 RepID=A0ABT6DG35_9BACT|nr:GNAT family N-acetyltransferase [Bdellovibrio svalbardensis]MDG0815210.1 GNAT family N-acetyltransferase [Bdellovibrio svalbardensis]
MHIEFTQADESHVDAIVTLVNSAYRGDSSKKGWTTEADLLGGQRVDSESIIAALTRDNSTILIAQDEDDDDKLVGCVHLEQHENKCYLGMLTVDPTLQKKGIGRMLVQESEAFAQFWDCTQIYMTVISVRKELIAWYEKLGFRNTGEKRPFPYGDERFGQPKVDNLEFVILEKKI